MLTKSIVISLLTVSLTGVASSQVLNQVALTINKKPITLAEFNYLFSKIEM